MISNKTYQSHKRVRIKIINLLHRLLGRQLTEVQGIRNRSDGNPGNAKGIVVSRRPVRMSVQVLRQLVASEKGLKQLQLA